MLRAIHRPFVQSKKYISRLKDLHDFSLVFTHNDNYLLIGCMDYPRCQETITFFLKRD